MPGPEYLDSDNHDDGDDQDRAEVLDETNLDDSEGVSRMRTFEELPDVYDVTRRDGDRDDDEGLALDAAEFEADAVNDEDELLEEDNELDYRAATQEQEDDLDGLGAEDEFDEDALDDDAVEGLDEEVADAELVTGGEDDFTNFQSKTLGDADLQRLGYAEAGPGAARAAEADDD